MPTFDTPEPIHVTVEIGFGTVQITTGDRANGLVQVLPCDPTSHKDVKTAERTVVEFADGHLRVSDPRAETRAWLGRGGSIQVALELPSGSHLTGKIAAELRCDGHLDEVEIRSFHGQVHLDDAGTIDIKADSGDIAASRVRHDARAETTFRDVRIGSIGGAATLKSSSGVISLGTIVGELRATSVSGDIAVGQAVAGVNASSKHGNIRIDEVVRGSVDLETTYGSVDLGVNGGTTARLHVDTKHGTVQNLLTPADYDGPAAETVDIHAVSDRGSIVLRHSRPKRSDHEHL